MIRLQKRFVGRSTCVILSLGLLLCSLKTEARPTTKALPPDTKTLSRKLSGSSLFFTENLGQAGDIAGHARPDILFTAHNGNAQVFLTATGISYQFTKVIYPEGYAKDGAAADPIKQAELEQQIKRQIHNFSLSLEGANPHPHVVKENRNTAVQNFYLPQCPNGVFNVSSYGKLVYEEVYPGIDWVLYSEGNHLKYDFVVKPGGDPSQIKLKIKDAASFTINEKGELVMKTSLGEVKEKAPVSFADGKLVKSSFRKNADGTIGFDIAAQKGQSMRIDPAVVWATYFGGTLSETGYGCTNDGSGHIYIAGYTASTTGLATSGMQTYAGGANDIFLAKFDSSGYLMWSTYYGGSGDDRGYALTRSGNNTIYVTGTTTSSSGVASASGVQQTSYGGGATDVLLAKFDTSGTRTWATYLGGTTSDILNPSFQNVATDINGNVYVTGTTNSSGNIATSGTFQSLLSGTGGFLVKYNSSGIRQWGTYYPAAGYACSPDASGNVYLSGLVNTGIGNIATAGTQQFTGGGGTDAYLAKFDIATGNRTWGTFYGGSGGETGGVCFTDNYGHVYLGGVASSTTAIATNGTSYAGSNDAFLAKFDVTTGSRIWGTYYGGPGAEQMNNAYIDATGKIYIVGLTASSSGINLNGVQTSIGGGTTANDAFLAQLDTSGTVQWSTYYGGALTDNGYGVTSDASGNIYLSGQAASTSGISIPGTYQSALAGSNDAFLVKIGTPGLYTGTLSSNSLCSGAAVSVPYTIYGVYNAGNVFTAQLSDSTGSFANPVNIGTVTTTAAGAINATIPAGTLPGTHYRIRVLGSNPFIIGTNNGADITINTTVSTAVSIAANPTGVICPGTSVTFTATPANGGSAPTYAWVKNGGSVGTNSITYTDAGLVNNDTISVIMTSNALCASPLTDTSNKIVMAVGSLQTPTISITANPTGAICTGTSVTFTATTTNNGTAVPTWYKNGTTTGVTGNTYTTITLANNDVITAVIISNAACASTAPVTSNGITMTVNPVVTPTISITANPTGAICAGTSVTFTATTTNSGTAVPTWYKNGTTTGVTGNTYTTITLANNDVITAVIISNATCASTAPVTSNGITMTVNPVVTPTISISANPSGAICAGTSVTFTATTTNNGTAVPTWYKNGTTTGITGNTYTTTTLANNDVITAVIISNATCANTAPVTSNTITMTVNPVVTPTISITANPSGAVCAGTSVTFTATTTNNGTAVPTWYKNGTTTGVTGNTYTTTTLANNDVITAVIISNATCASTAPVTSNSITMTVNPVVTPTISITANPSGAICAGTSVTFTATTTNNGTAVPTWYKNGTTTGVTGNTYTTTTLANNDVITAVIISNATCASTAPVTSNGITMTVNPVVTPTISITANPSGAICAGTSVTFTATTTNNGTAVPTWYKNGTTTGITGNTYTTTTLANNDVITAVIISNATCASTTPVTSNGITMTVNPVVTPTISITANPTGAICAGTSVTFTATTTNNGTAVPTWYKNGTTTGVTGNIYTTTTLANNDVITAVIISNAACASTAPVTSNGITMTVNPVVTPTISITANPTGAICAGTSVTFTATTTNNGTAVPTWYKNGTTTGVTGNTYTTTTLANNDVITAVIISNATCASTTPVTSNGITITVTPLAIPTIAIVSNPSGAICAGSSVTFTAVTSNPGSALPVWYKNGVATGNTGNTYTTTTLANNDVIKAVLTSNASCTSTVPVTSNSITVTVNPVVTPTVSIQAPANDTVCSGTPVTFTAVTTNAGSGTPAWFKNGTATGVTGLTYTTSTLSTGDVITATLTSTAACTSVNPVTSSSINIVVNTPVTPAVSITANASSPICSGTVVTYTATPVNGGTSPSYQWKKNGINVGTNSSTYIASGLVNNDAISVVLTSSIQCTTTPTATSNTITMSVFPVITPAVSISVAPNDTICTGTIATFTAAGTNGGTSPSYQWKKNGANVGFNSNTYSDNSLLTGDNILCVYTSNAVCVTNANVNSNQIGMVVNPCCDTPSNLTVNIITGGANFSWNAISGAAGFQYAATQSATPPATGSFITVSYASITNLQAGTYYFWVRTHCGNGVYSPWVRIMFTIPPTGIKNTTADGFSIKVFPNPVHDAATVKVDNMNGRKATLQLTDIAGRIIHQEEMNSSSASLSLDGLASGIYMLHYYDGLHNEVVRINKQ